MTGTTDVVAGVGALVVALAAAPVAGRLARRVGLVDRPGPLKPHDVPTPYLGGVAVALAVAVGAGFGRPWLLVPLGLALAVGVADDARPLPPGIRLIGQAAVGATLAAVVPIRLPGPWGPLLVVAATVVLVNGVNLVDGLDMLASSVVFSSAVGFAVLLSGGGRLVALATAGAVTGFLVSNRPPARIYLGDGGSYLLGTTLVALLAMSWAPGRPVAASAAALLLAAVPTAEVAFAVVRRRRARRPLFTGDRGHPYDRMVATGWSVVATVTAYGGAQLVLAGVAVALSRSSGTVAVGGVAVTAAVLLGLARTVGFLAPAPDRRPPASAGPAPDAAPRLP